MPADAFADAYHSQQRQDDVFDQHKAIKQDKGVKEGKPDIGAEISKVFEADKEYGQDEQRSTKENQSLQQLIRIVPADKPVYLP